MPGLAVTIVDTKGVIYKKGFGFANIQAAEPYTLKSIQPIGSVSKMILAVALMKATELGYFTLDTDINEILPFKVINPYQPDHVITIRKLTTHTSGLLDNPITFPNTYKFDLKRRPFSKDLMQLMKSMGYQQKIKDSTLKEFNYNYLSTEGKYYSKDNFVNISDSQKYVYSNIATALIAYIIEIKSGTSYSAFTSEYIFKPLSMNHSSWFTANVKLKDQARLYHNSNLIFPLYDFITYPDGGLKTNASDLSKFLVDMINGLSGRSVLLKQKSFQTMFTPQFSNQDPPKGIKLESRNKGILWNLYTNATIGHDGDDPGVSAYILFNPSNGLGGLFLCNKYLEDKSPLVNILTQTVTEGK